MPTGLFEMWKKWRIDTEKEKRNKEQKKKNECYHFSKKERKGTRIFFKM